MNIKRVLRCALIAVAIATAGPAGATGWPVIDIANLIQDVQQFLELTAQLERASLVLQNLALDLLRLRSLGVDTVTSATEQGRALSDNIGYALAAAEELRSNK